jgi:hypothetical integral membrane protein (TIGR02206 family)
MNRFVFRPFSIQHVTILLTFGLVILVALLIARSCKDSRRLRRVEMGAGLFALSLWFVGNGWEVWVSHFDFSQTLPLHLCDWVAMIMPLAFIFPRRTLYSLLYFWGLGLSTQAVLTPDLSQGPTTIAFWWFWINHVFIIGGAFYLVVVKKFKPRWRDYKISLQWGMIYLAVVIPVDFWCGYNYGYIGPDNPSQPTLINFLGPWPQRAFFMVLLACAGLALLVLPWGLTNPNRK